MDAQEFITEQNFDPKQLATLTREELVNTLKEIVENGEVTAIKEQVDCIKQLPRGTPSPSGTATGRSSS